MARAFDHTWQFRSRAAGQVGPSPRSSASWASSLASAIDPAAAVAEAPGHVVLVHDVAEFVEVV